MKKKSLWVLTILSFSLLSLVVYADGGNEWSCPGHRPLNKIEKDSYIKALSTFKSALPTQLRGLKLFKHTEIKPQAEKVCIEPGEALTINMMFEYADQNKILNNSADFQKNNVAERVTQLSEALMTAINKGDMKKVEEIKTQLVKLQTTPSGEMASTIEFRCNFGAVVEGNEDSVIFKVPGAKYALTNRTPGSKKVILYLGKNWEKEPESISINANFREKVPNTAIQFMEIIIDSEYAEEFARKINLAAINKLMK